jgi:hypothetical protein
MLCCIYQCGMAGNNNLEEFEKAPALIARDLMASRFPDFENRIREAFRLSSSFRDLCEDYYLVVTRQTELSDEHMDSAGSTAAILQSLQVELEQDMHNYIRLIDK